MGLGDRIAVMYEGRLRQIGPPREVYERPGRHVRGDLPRLAADEPGPPRRPAPRLPARAPPAGRARRRGDGSSADRSARQSPASSTSRATATSTATLHGIGEETRVIARLPATVTTPLEQRRRRATSRSTSATCASSTPRRASRPSRSRCGHERRGDRARAPSSPTGTRRPGPAVPAAGGRLHHRAGRVPAAAGDRLRLQRRHGRRPELRLGRLRNFDAIFDDPVFRRSLRNTVVFTVISMALIDRARPTSWRWSSRRLPRQVARAVPGPAALDDADRARRRRLALDARLGLQPDRLDPALARLHRDQHVLARQGHASRWRR